MTARLVDVYEAAELLSVSACTVRRLVWSGDLPCVRIGKLVRIRIADLEKWIEAETVRLGQPG